MKTITLCIALALLSLCAYAQNTTKFNGLDMNMGNLSRLSDAQTRSISPENFSGQKGQGGMADPATDKGKRNVANAAEPAEKLGKGWKVNPFIIINSNETFTIAEMEGPGAIQHIWMTPTGNWQFSIIRFYWDDEKEPSIEAPIGAFFGMAWNQYARLNSLAMTVNPGSAFNSYWKMPFRKKCRITVQNINNLEPMRLYYQVDYTLTPVGDDEGYFHAQYRRSTPGNGSLHTIVDNVKGKGQYVGTYMAVGTRNNGWWGEGEIKFFMDGDKDFATIVGTGTEDYFCGSYNFENSKTHQYEEFSTAYAGLHQVIRPDGLYNSQQRFGMYRWHIMDPIRFENGLKVTIQDLGWRHGGKYLAQNSDIITVAYWYQREPHAHFPTLPGRDVLEVN
ncbi:glycoside hydrolase family 172 protein [Mucilaginibacter lacusdianchii]|uniref:glycoside hydrolase family 172 protein n=1 Tax=Mucilaginibacter lacusdianchii TaxID=2684211 RepID=UPI00131D91F8|nr:glycoside hydrolase family 172 protein [Mucilaginibacter sp. JXJ CY 39]